MPSYRFGLFDFDPQTGRLLKGGTRIRLQRKPQQLLHVLLQHAGEAVTREQLRAHLWPNEAYRDFETGLNVAAKKLRDALCDSADEPSYISTEVGVGYRFIGAAERWVSETTRETRPQAQPSLQEADSRFVAQTLPPGKFARSAAAVAVAATCLLALLLIYAGAARRTGRLTTRSTFGAPEGWELLTTGDAGGSVALSPDGEKVVYVAANSKAETLLFLRRLDSLTSEAIPGTEGATMPFWSPDSARIGFFTSLELKVVDLSTHKNSTVCDLDRQSPRGGTWGASETIIFAGATRGPILKVPAAGGHPVPVTNLEHSNFTTHRWPRFLPDGKHFVFLAANHDPYGSAKSAIFLGSIDGSPARLVVESDSDAVFLGGELLFTSGEKLLAQAFDPGTGTLGSQARVLAENVEVDRSLWHASFDATEEALIYRPRPASPQLQVLKWFDESGNVLKPASKPGVFRGARASPDGRVIAAMCDEPDVNICLVREDGSLTRISEYPLNYGPVWSPDGAAIAYATHQGARQYGIAVKDARGELPERPVVDTLDGVAPTSWSPDGKELLVERTGDDRTRFLTALQLDHLKFHNFLAGAFDVRDGRFSPNGKWVAYYSNENGHDEIYVSSYPNPSRRYQVSHEGGRAARWGHDGESLFYLSASDTVMRVTVSPAGSGLKIGAPELLFRPEILRAPYDVQSFDVLATRKQLLINTQASQHGLDFVLVTSWRH